MFFVYVLQSEKDNKRYIGFTDNLERRLQEHTNGKVKSTKNRRPLKLVYLEEYDSKIETMNREKFLKSGFGRSFLKKIEK
jgi:putative endonuclease